VSNLTTAQKTAIASGPRYKQVWTVYVPQTVGSTTYDALTLDDSVNGVGGIHGRVIDAGQRIVEGYNQSLAEPGRLSNGLYRIVCDNSDNLMYSYFWTSTTPYVATPVECDLKHQVYVWSAGAWSELTCVQYRGRIQSVEYDDDKETATVEAVALAMKVLEYVFTEDDGEEEDTGMDVTWP
jgi:hypothetical protein